MVDDGVFSSSHCVWMKDLTAVTIFLQIVKTDESVNFEIVCTFQCDMLLKKLPDFVLEWDDATNALQMLLKSDCWPAELMRRLRNGISEAVRVTVQKPIMIHGSLKTQILECPDMYITLPIAKIAGAPGGVTASKLDLLAQFYVFLGFRQTDRLTD